MLIVEDDAALSRLYADALSAAGFHVFAQADAAGARSVLGGTAVDLAVLDVLLPGTSGFELAAELRRGGCGVPLLFVSGVYKASRHRDDVVEQFGALDFLEKPVAPDELVARVRGLLPESEAGAEDHTLPGAAATSPPLRPVAARGDLARVPFAAVYADLARRRASGRLFLHRERVRKIVSLHEGQAFRVTSNLLSECLGRVMVQAGMLSEADCDASLVRMRQTGLPQGRVLVAAGLLTPRSLTYALQLQLEQKLFDLFTWDTGDYRFEAAEEPGLPEAVLEMTPARVLYEGLVRGGDDGRVWRVLDACGGLPEGLVRQGLGLRDLAPKARRGAAGVVAGMGLDASVEDLFAGLDGATPLSELLGGHAVPAHETLALVTALRCLHLVDLVPPTLDGETTGLHKRLPPQPEPPREAITLARLSPGAAPAFEERMGGRPVDAHLAGATTRPDADAVADAAVLRPLSARDRAAWERLAARLQDLRRASHYEALGIDRGADAAQVRRAYAGLAREYDPDRRHPGRPAPVRALAAHLLERLAEARDVLSDPARRAAYDAGHPVDRAESDAARAERILRSDEVFRNAARLLAAGANSEAAAQLREAAELHPEEAEYRAWLGWALWRAHGEAPGAGGRVLAHLAAALQASPRLPVAHLLAARVHAELGQLDAARRAAALGAAAGPPPPGALPPGAAPPAFPARPGPTP